ncbi:hypothetical protein BKA70DRAFT_1082829, partial [Coprinopsis sp. MPI-PUGE-AT-0042]
GEESTLEGPAEGPAVSPAEGRARKSKKRRKTSTPRLQQTDPPAPGEGSKKTKKNKARKKAKQQTEREQEFREHGHQPLPSMYKKYVSPAEPIAIAVDLDLNSLPATSCGYQAKPNDSSQATTMSLSSLQEEGYTVEAWDGMSNKVFVDPVTSKIFAACVGRPSDESFDKAVEDAFEAMEAARVMCNFNLDDWLHRRGHFPALNAGISYGQGQKAAQNLDNGKGYNVILQGLMSHPAIIRLAHYASASFAMFAPNVYQYYHTRFSALLDERPELNRNFARSVFAAAAFNFGPQVATFPHRDCMNSPFGWCAVQALGRFDSTKGGHLVLPELKVAIEFPAGSLILIPSATLTHANHPFRKVRPGLHSPSFRQGVSFALLTYGFQTETELLIKDEDAYWRVIEDKKLRWKRGLRLWSAVEELLS